MSNGVDPLFYARQVTLLAARLATAEVFRDHLCDWMKTNAPETLEAIREEVHLIATNARLEFQKKIGAILKDFGVENPL